MSDINDVFDSAVSSPSFFNPNEEPVKKKNIGNVKGDFYGHMIEAEQKEVEFSKDGKTFKAVVYNYKFVVHKDNSFNNKCIKYYDSKKNFFKISNLLLQQYNQTE